MRKRGRPASPGLLTPREQEVLDFLRASLTNPEIGERLGISLETVKQHVSEILSKLGVATREEAAAWQPEPKRRWSFGRIVLAIAGTALVAAAVAGLALLAWGLSRSGTSEEIIAIPSGSSSPATSAATPTPSPAALSYFPPGFVQFGRQLDQALANQDTAFFTDNVVFGQWGCGGGAPPTGPGPNCLPSTSGGGPGILLGAWNSEGDVLSPATYDNYITGILSGVKTGTSDAYGEATPRILAAADLSDNIEGENTADTYEFVVTAISSDPNANVGPALVPPGADPSRIALVFFVRPIDSAWKIIRIDRAVRSLIDPYSPSGVSDGDDRALKAWLLWSAFTGVTQTPAAPTSSLFPDSVWMAGATSGWLAGVEKACADGSAVCGGLILHTNDSGGSWDEQYRGQVQVSKIAFDGDQRGFAIGPTQQCSGNPPCPSGILLTTDGGLHWQEVTTTPLHLTGIGLADGDAWLIGQQCPPDQPSSACGWHLLDSANGGDTWTQSTLPISGFALDLSRPTANDAWIVTSPSGPGTAQLIATHDAGQTWQSLPGPPDGLSLEQRIFFRTTSEGWLLVGSEPGAGSQPKVLYSTADGGQTWTLVSGSFTPGTGIALPGSGLTASGYLGPMLFTSDLDGWITSPRAGLLHSTDGGANWSIALQDDNLLQDMHFADADHGWAVSGITLWSTDDGGVNWTSHSLPDSGNP